MAHMSFKKMIETHGSAESRAELSRRLEQSAEVVHNVRRKLGYMFGKEESLEWAFSIECGKLDLNSAYWTEGGRAVYSTNGKRYTIDPVFVLSSVRDVAFKTRMAVLSAKLEDGRQELKDRRESIEQKRAELESLEKQLETSMEDLNIKEIAWNKAKIHFHEKELRKSNRESS